MCGANMRIAILGTRGVPGRYGGFETFAEHLSRRLAARGHQVTVYCRRPFVSPSDVVPAGVQRVILPTISHKYFDTFVHTFLSVMHVLFTDAEIVLMCNVANSPWAWIPRLAGKPTVLNVDGLDRKRRKWNFLGRSFLFFCEALATLTPTRIVTDAKLVQQYFENRYGARSTMIAYGAEAPPGNDSVEEMGLAPEQFILYVSRLEPENNPEMVIRAYARLRGDWPLVIVGGNSYDRPYVHRLESLADERVIFTGPVYGSGYWRLLKNAGLYIFACEVGGVHPALIEAMAAGRAILYLDTPENRETARDCAVPFPAGDHNLAAQMELLLADAGLRRNLGEKARMRAEALFGWEEITNRYESLLAELLERTRVAAPAR
jgi:glycosyltransferase involved in cell wall biosynthesis